jgi:hypothetical protein
LKSQEALCQRQKHNLEQEIEQLRTLASMTDDDEKIALMRRVNLLQGQFRTGEDEREALGVLVRQLRQQNTENNVVLQQIRVALSLAHKEMYKLRSVAEADGALEVARPRLVKNKSAYAVLHRLLILLEDRLRRLAATPGKHPFPRLINMTPIDGQWLGVLNLEEFITLIFHNITLLPNNKSAAPEQPKPTEGLDKLIKREAIEVLGGLLTQSRETERGDAETMAMLEELDLRPRHDDGNQD